MAWYQWPPLPAKEGPSPSAVRLADKGKIRQEPVTPWERVVKLAELADAWLADADTLAGNPAEAARLARDFEGLVLSDLFEEAQRIPVKERPLALKEIAERVLRAESKATTLASRWDGRHPASARSMRQIAESAREAERKLRRLAEARA
jgi:hypothetical protein